MQTGLWFNTQTKESKVELSRLIQYLRTEGIRTFYYGPFTYNVINELGYHIKQYLDNSKSVRDKVFYAFVELCENIGSYAVTYEVVGNKRVGTGLVALGEDQNGYCIQAINYATPQQQKELQQRLAQVKNMSRRELRAYKNELRQQAIQNHHPSGNIGLIEILLRLDKKVDFQWIDAGENLVLFIVKAYIDKKEDSGPKMDDLVVKGEKGTYLTPDVYFSAQTGVCEIKGESYQEDTFEFYNTLINWIDTYIHEVKKPITFNLKLTYFNTSSSRALQEIFLLLKEYQEQGGEVTINWYYLLHDESMLEEAEDFQLSTGMKFNIISVEKFD
jgi:hypothetical protein